MPFTVVIPARYASTRLPGKVLSEIAGKPLIQHVHERALESGATRVLIGTDDARVQELAGGFGAEVIMTDPVHQSGTDRVAEVIENAGLVEDAVVVNLQGDEPEMPPQLIRQVADLLSSSPGADMATLCEPISEPERVFDPNLVKVVTAQDGRALYFSRAPIPWERARFERGPPAVLGSAYFGHIGIYAYRAGFIQQFTKLPICEAERTEGLEQLRALHHGFHIQVAIASHPAGRAIDTPQDLERVRRDAVDLTNPLFKSMN